MKTITIAGRNVKDAETRDAGQSRVTSWSVAVDDGWGQNKSTMFFDIDLWGKRGDALRPNIRKGENITVSGELKTRENNGKTYLKIEATDVTLQGGKRQGQGYTPEGPQAYAAQRGAAQNGGFGGAPARTPGDNSDLDDQDIPF